MLLALSIISAQGADLGSTAYKVFDERGGSIGRIDSNDWVLPDADRFVSSRHATVRWGGDAFYLEDVSSNGTFINAPDRAISKTEPTRLTDGDRLFIGDYEIMVQLIGAAPAAAPAPVATAAPAPAPLPAVNPAGLGLGTVDPLAVLGGARSEPRRAPAPPAAVAATAAHRAPAAQPAAAASGIPDDWQATAFNRPPGGGAPSAAVAPVAAPSPVRPAALTPGSADDILTALGLDAARADPVIREQLGLILRIAVDGLIEALKSRAEVKNNFRMPMTSIKPVENNPLKFSMNAQDALHNLFVKRNPGYLGPVEAFEEGFQDVAFHQAAMLAGIRAAFTAMLAKFHPNHLEVLYERKLRRTAVLGLGGKGKFWEQYRLQFEEIDRDRDASFQLLFGEEFAKAYNEQLQQLAARSRSKKR
jgi:type VI secretion system FHA domain protein